MFVEGTDTQLSWWEHTAKADTLNPVYRASFRGRVT